MAERKPREDTPNTNQLYDAVCRLKELLEDSEGAGMFSWHQLVHQQLERIKEVA